MRVGMVSAKPVKAEGSGGSGVVGVTTFGIAKETRGGGEVR